jgi:hypothetical protein
VFLTVIVNVAVPPLATVWAFGSFTIEIAGLEGVAGGVSGEVLVVVVVLWVTVTGVVTVTVTGTVVVLVDVLVVVVVVVGHGVTFGVVTTGIGGGPGNVGNVGESLGSVGNSGHIACDASAVDALYVPAYAPRLSRSNRAAPAKNRFIPPSLSLDWGTAVWYFQPADGQCDRRVSRVRLLEHDLDLAAHALGNDHLGLADYHSEAGEVVAHADKIGVGRGRARVGGAGEPRVSDRHARSQGD